MEALLRCDRENSFSKMLNGENVKHIIIGGRTGVGKSSVIMRLAHMKASMNYNVYFISKNLSVNHKNIKNIHVNQFTTSLFETLQNISTSGFEADKTLLVIDDAYDDYICNFHHDHAPRVRLPSSNMDAGRLHLVETLKSMEINSVISTYISTASVDIASEGIKSTSLAIADILLIVKKYVRTDSSCICCIKDNVDFKIFMKPARHVTTTYEF